MTSKKARKSTGRPKAARRARPSLAHISAASERRGPVQARARQTVDAIVEAAGQLLVTHGRTAITTNAVAARAGVSIGSLYQYFPNKESIFAALRERHKDQVMPLIQHALANLADPQVDLVDGTVALMRGLAQLHENAPLRMRVLVDELGEGSEEEAADGFVNAIIRALHVRTALPSEDLRPTAWLAYVAMSQIGRTLVHRPPVLDLETLLGELGHMLRGLFHRVYQP